MMEDLRKDQEITEDITEDPDLQDTENGEAAEAAAPEEAETSAKAPGEAAEDSETAEESAEDAAAEEEASAGSEKKGFFGKKKKEDKERAALHAKIEELEDRTKRQMAEFENFRKRSDREKAQMFSMGEQNVLENILPIIDNFERGFDTVAPEDQDDAFVDGMRKIYAQLMKQMEDLGVTPIEALGQDFDPNFHNAVMQVQSEELEPGKVGQELLKGYMYHDSVLRHSMVGVVSE
ncbi:MAG: nucleotide exchange factor GrpE [Lachnospiraceae bacterium]|nr:nucleotide exchange factor GrpE [Lachnospiraceae bacterium]